jgi:hypothetical protein
MANRMCEHSTILLVEHGEFICIVVAGEARPLHVKQDIGSTVAVGTCASAACSSLKIGNIGAATWR